MAQPSEEDRIETKQDLIARTLSLESTDSKDTDEIKRRKKVMVFAESRMNDYPRYTMNDVNLPKSLKDLSNENNKTAKAYYDANLNKRKLDLESKNKAKAYIRGFYSTDEYEEKKGSPEGMSMYVNQTKKYREEGGYDDINKSIDVYKKRINEIRDEFYNEEINPIEKLRDPTFITEANNVKSFYARTDPNVDVEVIPFYEEADLFKNKVDTLEKDDDIAIFGHYGSRIGGILNEDIASFIKDSKSENCYLGSCHFENEIEKFSGTGKNIHYRKNTQWLGFNPQADDFTKGMWSRNNKKDTEGTYYGEPVITDVTEGKEYSIMKPLLSGEN